jgi:hypothetical protein
MVSVLLAKGFFMLASRRGLSTALAALAVLAFGSPSYALPYFSGSFAMTTFTSSTTNVDATAVFALTSAVAAGSAAGDFASEPPPATLMSPASLDFTAGMGFDWSDPGTGAFVASGVVPLASPVGVSNWNVTGSFTVGSNFDNAGDVLTANMIWSATQTGGPGESTSLSGTFHSPAIEVPEPAALALLGAGLFAIGLELRRREKT